MILVNRLLGFLNRQRSGGSCAFLVVIVEISTFWACKSSFYTWIKVRFLWRVADDAINYEYSSWFLTIKRVHISFIEAAYALMTVLRVFGLYMVVRPNLDQCVLCSRRLHVQTTSSALEPISFFMYIYLHR